MTASFDLQNHYNCTRMTLRSRFAPVFLLLSLYTAFMISTNHRLTILDDEGLIITTANIPTLVRLRSFIHGHGQHLHPPLTDSLLHWWLILTHHSFTWLRIPSILVYVAGLLVLAQCGRLLGNSRTYWAVLLFGTLWPFGYFYARITGWYSLSFLLIACVTYCYFLLLQHSSNGRWVSFGIAAILLVWSNYFGVTVLLLLLADLLIRHRLFVKPHRVQLCLTLSAVLLCFAPLLGDLRMSRHATDPLAAPTWLAAIEKIGFMLFALLSSVAVAPWFLAWSVPALVATVVLYVLLLAQTGSRPFALYFFLLILGLSASHTLDLKRLLFITPWLMLSIALCCSTGTKAARTAVAAIAVVFTIGWIGIANGRHRATSNFYEPWRAVATSVAAKTTPRDAIISDSISFFFQLDYALGLNDVESTGTYLGQDAYLRRGLSVFRDGLPDDVDPTSFLRITTIRGAGIARDTEAMARTMAQLQQSCRLVGAERYVPDPAAGYKQEVNPRAPSTPFRIEVDDFDCSANTPPYRVQAETSSEPR
jgi:hypothetical protein